MKILAICKDTGYNFIRHYTKNMANTAVCLTRNPREAWQCIEMKTPKGRQQPNQKEFEAEVIKHGYGYCLPRSLEEFKQCVVNYLEKGEY